MDVSVDRCWLEFPGGRYYPFEPERTNFDIKCIAHSLANTVRYQGHVPYDGDSDSSYSVAEHCCIGALLAPDHLKFQFLMHDAQEAYLGDVPPPLKDILTEYRKLEDMCCRAMSRVFEFEYPFYREVGMIDHGLTYQEGKIFGMNVEEWNLDPYWRTENVKLKMLSARKAEEWFLDLYKKFKPY